jgi:hypothetical protein
MNVKIISIFLVSFLAFFATACDSNDGPMEKAGERVDEAVDESKDTLEKVGENGKSVIEDMGDKVEDATDS